MPLQLKIVSNHKDLVGNDATRVFDEHGGTIGRSLQNDWILPDPDRYISGKHATIDCKGGIYYLADISTNGVYVNDEAEPIGRGNPRRLFNGDRLHLGDFEIAVTIDEGEGLELPEPPKPSVAPDHIEQFVPEVTLKTGIALIDEEEITGDDAFQSVMFGSGIKPLPEREPAVPPEPAPKVEQRTETPQPQHAEHAGTDLLAAFFQGLGIDREDLHPSTDMAQTMRNAGEVLREYVDGTHKLLASRAGFKSTFRLDKTAILPRHNNALKLSLNTNDSIRQLLVGDHGDYLGPRDSVREVCRDLLTHQDALVDAMTTAFLDFVERFDPDELAESFDQTTGRKPFLKALHDARCWQRYRELYPTLTEIGDDRFPQMIADEFVKAYDRAAGATVRPDRSAQQVTPSKPMSDTQKFDRKPQAANQDEGTAPAPAANEPSLGDEVPFGDEAPFGEDLPFGDDVREPTLEEEIAALPDPEAVKG